MLTHGTSRGGSNWAVWIPLPLLVVSLVPVLSVPVWAAETPAIVVNGESVPMEVYERKLDSWMHQMKKRRQKQSSSSSPRKSSPEELRKHTRNELVKRLVNRLVIETHAKRASIPVSEREVDREWKNMARRYGGESKLRNAIKNKGRTEKQVRKQLKLAIKVQKYIEKKTPNYHPTDKELRNYYEDHPVQFKGKTFGEVKRVIQRSLRKQKKHQSLVRLMEKLREQSDIRVNV